MGFKARRGSSSLSAEVLLGARESGVEAATRADDSCDLDNYVDPEEPDNEASDLGYDYWNDLGYRERVVALLKEEATEINAESMVFDVFMTSFLEHCRELVGSERAPLVQ